MRRELLVAIGIAWLLVIARSAVYTWYPQSFFESDQAIVGLMAKHLVEGRAFPLFYYGQTYMLAVDAWVAAPFFLIAGPTVAALHASLVFTNLVIVTVLIASLERWCGVRPLLGLTASLFFAFAPPFTAASLVEAGANIGPFLYVLLLWIVRDRPLWFGAILAFGFLNREFTIYAVPVVLIGQLLDGRLFRVDRIRQWLIAAVAFLAMWQTIEALKPFADLMGPGTRGQPMHETAGSQVNNIIERVSIAPGELLERAHVMVTDFFPREIGARFVDSWTASQGHDWLYWPITLGLLAAAVRALVLSRSRPPAGETPRSSAFGWYLFGVGFIAACGYVLSRPATLPVNRYLLLTIYIPIGITAAFFALEPRAWPRRAMVALVLGWALSSAVDHGRLAAAYWGGQVPDPGQEISDALVARGVRVAEAGYWRAYLVSFLSRERVKVASSDVVRIEEYQRLAREEGDRLLVIQETPCAGEQIGHWFLCRHP